MLADLVPIYPLYSLLFAHAGMSRGEISGLFAVWSLTGLLAEVPAGALADRFSRRGALVAGGVAQGCAYVSWILFPGFGGFAGGFVIWGLGGSLTSGALEALSFEGMAHSGAESHYSSVFGLVSTAGLLAQLPTALAASILFSAGGYSLVGWASVGCCLGAAALAACLPDARGVPPAGAPPPGHGTETPSYLAILRAGWNQALAQPGVRGAVLAVALLTAADAIEEYFALLARSWGVPTGLVPLAIAGIPLVGAVGAVIGGRLPAFRPYALTCLLGAGVVMLGSAGLVRRPVGLVGVAVFLGLYRLVLVVVSAQLQDCIVGSSRATVTSVASMGAEVVSLGLFGAWSLGGLEPVAAGLLALVVGLPALLRGSGGTRS